MGEQRFTRCFVFFEFFLCGADGVSLPLCAFVVIKSEAMLLLLSGIDPLAPFHYA